MTTWAAGTIGVPPFLGPIGWREVETLQRGSVSQALRPLLTRAVQVAHDIVDYRAQCDAALGERWVKSVGTALRNQQTGPRRTKVAVDLGKEQALPSDVTGCCDRTVFGFGRYSSNFNGLGMAERKSSLPVTVGIPYHPRELVGLDQFLLPASHAPSPTTTRNRPQRMLMPGVD